MAYDLEQDRMERERFHFNWIPMNDSRIQMLRSLRDTCKDCVMCGLGRDMAVTHGERIDPHVFSNMQPSKFMVVGQNPGYNECKQDQPFVGEAGQNFNVEIEKYGLTRDNFYITNAVKCLSPDNRAPTPDEVVRCSPFLTMEITLLNPKFIITLGATAFAHFCPKAIYNKALGTFTYSEEFKKKIFAIYHPSPRNLTEESRKALYQRQIQLLAGVIKVMQK